ncbi:dihydrofolate reductase [Paenibacillus paeoniae]|uniref:Dihydrofolate reductase n=1 Tax=Paenibacillus paeoniae TaxID=2292705 RepID=A0A371PLN4_9BACL|nr:dihydrofolate reductase [Paenibacillus paeoniae]REK77101.1 dihydrofolate reductase [Paenibacillus paeoniae]
MSITLIAAMDRNRAIGYENQLLWHLPGDMAFFRRTTTGKTVLMGRKTFDSIGKPLPNRRNLILTRQSTLELDGCEIIHSPEEALEKFRHEEIMILGGSEVYTWMLPFADRLLLTEVDAEIDKADAYFPEFDKRIWGLKDSVFNQKDERNPYDYTFQTYERAER